ncbi:MAG: hypothetical protein OXF48_05255, partial [Bacteroidetes bacterium]|nr:hypothetical protein [Bacteroidota bacterium]
NACRRRSFVRERYAQLRLCFAVRFPQSAIRSQSIYTRVKYRIELKSTNLICPIMMENWRI